MSDATDPTPPLPYATPHGRPGFRFSWLVFVSSGAVVLVASVFLAWFVPEIETVFMDFHLDLPWGTQMLLVVAHAFQGGGWIVGLLLPVALGVLAPRLVRRREVADVVALSRLADPLPSPPPEYRGRESGGENVSAQEN